MAFHRVEANPTVLGLRFHVQHIVALKNTSFCIAHVTSDLGGVYVLVDHEHTQSCFAFDLLTTMTLIDIFAEWCMNSCVVTWKIIPSYAHLVVFFLRQITE